MTDRERLTSLIRSGMEYIKNNIVGLRSYGDLADYLLANGVIVPPCKVGDTVYIPVLNAILYTKVFAFGVDEDGNKVINPKEYPEGVFGVTGCEIGKTVFLTKEEAEAKLKELKERGTENGTGG